MSSLGVYFISTKDASGSILRNMLNIDYNLLAFQLELSLPGERPTSFIYFFDLFTHQAPKDIKNPWTYVQFTSCDFDTLEISYISYKYYTKEIERDDVRKEMRKFISHYCLHCHAESQEHWKSLIDKEWHPEKNLSLLSDFCLSENTVWLDSQNDMNNKVKEPDVREFLMLLNERSENIKCQKTVQELATIISQWKQTVTQGAMPLVFLRPIEEVLSQLLSDYTSIEISTTSVPCMMIFGNTIELPENTDF